MHSRVDPPVRPHEALLERERVNQVELAPHHDPAAGLLRLLHGEAAVFEAKHI